MNLFCSETVPLGWRVLTAPRWGPLPECRGERPVYAARVSVLRAIWFGLALAAVAFAVSASMSPVSDVSLLCSKTGELGLDGDQASLECGDSIIRVMGVWPLASLGLLLATPAVVAAFAMRRWVSWLVVATFVGLTFAGIANWASFWVSLWFAIPMAGIGLVVATVQQVITPRNQL